MCMDSCACVCACVRMRAFVSVCLAAQAVAVGENMLPVSAGDIREGRGDEGNNERRRRHASLQSYLRGPVLLLKALCSALSH